MRRTLTGVLCALAIACVALAGCQNSRYCALEGYPASGLGFKPEEVGRKASLKKGQPYALHTLREADKQGLYYLQVRPGKRLPGRYHEGQGLTLVATAGEAAVEVEGRRYQVDAGTALFIPETHSYTVSARDREENFAAFLVFAPPYDPEAVELTGE